MKIILTLFFTLGLFLVSAFSEPTQMKVMKELEAQEKAAPPETITRPKVEYTSGGLRDPFLKTTESKATEPGLGKQPPPLSVQGLIWGGKFPQAIVNNKVVKVGDIVEGARVISIDKTGIEIIFEGNSFRLSPQAAGSAPAKRNY